MPSSAKKSATPEQARGDALLTKARALYDRWKPMEFGDARAAAYDVMERGIIEAAPALHEVVVATDERARGFNLVMNARGAGLDGIRFKAPPVGQEYRLYWELVVPGNTQETVDVEFSDIAPVAGGHLFFGRIRERKDVQIPGVNLPEVNLRMSLHLSSRNRLRAGAEYIIWMAFKSGRPTPTYHELWVEPVQPVEPPTSPTAQKARAAFQASLESLNERYDGDAKSARRKYLNELDKGAAPPAKTGPRFNRIRAEADRVNRGDSDATDPRGLRILRAEYGAGDRWMDVTMPLRTLIRDDALIYEPGPNAVNGFKPDPHFGNRKTLIVVYGFNGVPGVSTTTDVQRVELPPPRGPGEGRPRQALSGPPFIDGPAGPGSGTSGGSHRRRWHRRCRPGNTCRAGGPCNRGSPEGS